MGLPISALSPFLRFASDSGKTDRFCIFLVRPFLKYPIRRKPDFGVLLYEGLKTMYASLYCNDLYAFFMIPNTAKNIPFVGDLQGCNTIDTEELRWADGA